MPNTVLSRIDERLIHGQVGDNGLGLPGRTWYGWPTMKLPTIPYSKICWKWCVSGRCKSRSSKQSVDACDITAFNVLKANGMECLVQSVPTEVALDIFTQH